MNAIDVAMKLKVGEVVSASILQKEFNLGYVKARELFDELLDEGFIVKDKGRDRYTYEAIRFREMMEIKYGDLHQLIASYNTNKEIDPPKGMKKVEFIKLILDSEKGMNIIFLDIDGVLNSRSTKDKCGPYRGIEDNKILLLKKLVDKYDAKIVLISSWKEKWFKSEYLKDKQDDLANYLDMKMKKLGLEIYDKTNELYSRTGGIRAYLSELHERGIALNNYVIINDEMERYKNVSTCRPHIIQTSFEKEGLTRKHIEKASSIFDKSMDANKHYW